MSDRSSTTGTRKRGSKRRRRRSKRKEEWRVGGESYVSNVKCCRAVSDRSRTMDTKDGGEEEEEEEWGGGRGGKSYASTVDVAVE